VRVTIAGAVLLLGGLLLIAGAWYPIHAHIGVCRDIGVGVPRVRTSIGLTLPIPAVQFCPNAWPLFVAYYAGYLLSLAGMVALLRARLSLAGLAALTVAACTIAALVPFFLTTDPYAYALYAYEVAVMHVSPYAAHSLRHEPAIAPIATLFTVVSGERTANYGPYLLPYAYLIGPLSKWSLYAMLVAERVLGAVCLVLTGLLVAASAQRGCARRAFTWIALNPLLLTQSISFAHGDIIMLMLLAAAYLAFRKNSVAVCAACCVLATETRGVAALALAALLVALLRDGRYRPAATACISAALTLAVTALIARVSLGAFTLGSAPTLAMGGAPLMVIALFFSHNSLSTLGYAMIAQALLGGALVAVALATQSYRFAAPALLAGLPVIRAWYLQWLAPIGALTTDGALKRATLALFALAPLGELPEMLNRSNALVWSLIDLVQWGAPIAVYAVVRRREHEQGVES
jgi:hypothetical protein